MLSMPSLILILVIVILLFGTKRLKNIGGDLGSALKGFKKAVNDGDNKKPDNIDNKSDSANDDNVIEGEVIKEKEKQETK